MPERVKPGGRSRERTRFLGLLAEHVLAIARLRARAALGSPPPPYDGGRPLRVAFLSVYPADHYGTVSRLTRWVPHLEARGCRVRIFHPGADRDFQDFLRGDVDASYRFHRAALRRVTRNLIAAARHDVIYLHRGALPFGPWQRPTLEGALRRLNPRIVYDFYDSIWVGREKAHRGARGRAARWLNPPDLVGRLIGQASAVTVANEHLAAFARRHHGDVRVLPMLLDPSEYTPTRHRDVARVTLGWMGGPWNVTRLESIAPALRRVAKRTPIRLRVVTRRPVEIPGLTVECLTHPWTPRNEAEDLAALDVGLLPMFDDERDRGKSPLKLLQYAAAGLPIVASPVAVDSRTFPPGVAIRFAATETEWVEALLALSRDVSLRASLGAAARRAVEEHYSFEGHARNFRSLLAEVASRSATPSGRAPP